MLKWQGNHDLVITIRSCYDMLMITCGFVFFLKENLSFSSWIYTLSNSVFFKTRLCSIEFRSFQPKPKIRREAWLKAENGFVVAVLPPAR